MTAPAHPRTSGRDRAYHWIKDEVVADPSVQGQFINEQDVAKELEISRTPVREALLLLAAEGLVQLVPRRGAWVPPVGAQEMNELAELRRMVEHFGAERALALHTTPTQAMRKVLDEQRRLVGAHRARDFIELDSQFHTELVAAAGNSLLIKMYAGLRDRQVRAGLIALGARQTREAEVIEEHEAILEALDGGELADVRAAVDHHLDLTVRAFLAV